MTISIGDELPKASFLKMGADGAETIELSDMAADKKIVIFGLPGAFTGVCTTAHLPSFIRNADKLREKGVDGIYCVAVNDVFVMEAWDKSTGATDAGINMIVDPESHFIKEIGLDFTAPPVGLISRSKRFAMLVESGKVTKLDVESSPGECTISAGESVVDWL